MRIYKNRSREIFNCAKAPVTVYEEQFDGFDKALKKLASTEFDKIEPNDLWYYLHDLSYMELQPDLFNYLFPACLDFWHQTLLTNNDAGIGDSEFHYAIYKGNILEKMLTEDQKQEILYFFTDGFLDKADLENQLIQTEKSDSIYQFYNLVYRFNSLGYIMPIKNLWLDWWDLDTKGKAISIIKYSTGLIYETSENPLFIDGYGPFLSQSDSQIYNEAWPKENIDFMKNILNSTYIQNKLREATELLTDDQLVQKIYQDSLKNKDFIDLRINYLLNELSLSEIERDVD